MSKIHIIIIKKDKLDHFFLNYKDVIQLLKNHNTPNSDNKIKTDNYLDAGYIIIDHNSKIIIDNQFAINKIKTKQNYQYQKIW